MSIPAITDDGFAVKEDSAVVTPSQRAAPRLWAPDAPPETELPAAVAPKRRTRCQSAPRGTPAASPETRDRYSPTLKELPAEERPRERLHAWGAHALTTAELIAILIRVGTKERSAVSLGEYLLSEFGSIKGVASASLEQLAGVKGLGAAKAAQIKAAIEFGNRLALFTEDARPSIGGPRDVANLLMPDLRYQKKEHLTSCKVSAKVPAPNKPGMNVTIARQRPRPQVSHRPLIPLLPLLAVKETASAISRPARQLTQ